MTRTRLTGYASHLSARAGDTVQFMISAEGIDEVAVDLVRLIHGDEHPEGPGFVERDVPSELTGAYPGRKQFVQTGAYVEVDDPDGRLAVEGPFTLHAFIFPTRIGEARRVVLGKWDQASGRGAALGIDQSGHLEFWVGDGVTVDSAAADIPLVARSWYFVAASYDAGSNTVTLVQRRIVNSFNSLHGPATPFVADETVQRHVRVRPQWPATRFMWSGASDDDAQRGRHVTLQFNGKIDRCGVVGRAVGVDELETMATGSPASDGVIAAWDTTAGLTAQGVGDQIIDTGPHGLHGLGVNRPVRAMTGWNWTGDVQDFRLDPDVYGGIAFHTDAIIDCRWEPTCGFTVPDDLPSGIYAAWASRWRP